MVGKVASWKERISIELPQLVSERVVKAVINSKLIGRFGKPDATQIEDEGRHQVRWVAVSEVFICVCLG